MRLSCREQVARDALVRLDARTQLIDVDELIWRVSDVNRSGTEQQRRAPAREEWNVGRVRHRSRVEPGHQMKVLRGNRASEFDLRAAFPPGLHHFFHRFDVAYESDHQLCFTMRGNDVRTCSAANRSDVDCRV